MNQNTEKNSHNVKPPVRGSLRLSVSSSTQKVIAGSDFSIFITIQNPFDTPITVYQTQTHIPVELIDVNGMRIRQLQSRAVGDAPWFNRVRDAIAYRLRARREHTGVAVAIGTDFEPGGVEREFARISTNIERMEGDATVIGMQFSFPENPSTEELDQIFRRLIDYRKGLSPIQLQPGDSVVKQFVLKTRKWLLFTPLTHKFQIQINYSCDGVDHADTITHEQSIQASMKATILGGCAGAVMGTLLKSLTQSAAIEGLSIFKVMVASVLASVAVVVAFARKAGSQPVVSVEDFWGGALIGFTCGFFGFQQFFALFGAEGS